MTKRQKLCGESRNFPDSDFVAGHHHFSTTNGVGSSKKNSDDLLMTPVLTTPMTADAWCGKKSPGKSWFRRYVF